MKASVQIVSLCVTTSGDVRLGVAVGEAARRLTVEGECRLITAPSVPVPCTFSDPGLHLDENVFVGTHHEAGGEDAAATGAFLCAQSRLASGAPPVTLYHQSC